MLTRQALETTRLVFRLFREFSLRSAPASAPAPTTTPRLAAELFAHRLGHALQALVLLLLPSGKLFQALDRFVNGLLRLLLLRLLRQCLILIFQLVGLQLEQVGEILRLLLRTTAATTAGLSADLYLDVAIEGLGGLKMLQCLLLRGQRRVALRLHESLLGGDHRDDGRVELDLDLPEVRVGQHRVPSHDPRRERRDLLAQPALGDVHGRDVFAALALHRRGAVAEPVERAGYDFTLTRNEARRTVPAPPTAATSLLFRLPIRLPEWSHLEEVDVAGSDIAGAVPGNGIVRDEIAGLELHLFQEQRVRHA